MPKWEWPQGKKKKKKEKKEKKEDLKELGSLDQVKAVGQVIQGSHLFCRIGSQPPGDIGSCVGAGEAPRPLACRPVLQTKLVSLPHPCL